MNFVRNQKDDIVQIEHLCNSITYNFMNDSKLHIFFIAEPKGTMESLKLKLIETAKIQCAKKLFQYLSMIDVFYHDDDTYQHLLDVMEAIYNVDM